MYVNLKGGMGREIIIISAELLKPCYHYNAKIISPFKFSC